MQMISNFALGVFKKIDISFMGDNTKKMLWCRMDTSRVLILKFSMPPISKSHNLTKSWHCLTDHKLD